MKTFAKKTSLIASLIITSLSVHAGNVGTTFADGNTLDAATMNGIATAINDNDSRVNTITSTACGAGMAVVSFDYLGNATCSAVGTTYTPGTGIDITTGIISVSSIGSAQITDLSVGTADLAANSVTSAKIVDGTITAADIATDAVTGAKIAPAAVGSTEILDNSITKVDIQDEPGIEYDNVSASSTAPFTSGKVLDTLVMTIPGTGFVMCIAHVEVSWNSTPANGHAYAGWTTGTGTSINDAWTNTPGGISWTSFMAMNTFSVSAGTVNFNLTATTSDATATVASKRRACTYFPTQY